ncbi:MAG: hypothetical protein H7067_07395 [Burkholderiales bacterium]|nr:hypothetical protein [Opitutaceae bacterium]
MQLRKNEGSRPQITFTSDFHELVQGDLVPGPCVLRYDPLRLVSLGDAAEEAHHIRAYVRYHPVGVEWQGVMELPAGLPLRDSADITGEGIMLTSTFEIPEGCDELEVWFSCTHDDGQTHWDSDHGKNHWLRFGLEDLTLKTAKVKPAKKKTAAQDSLEFEFSTAAEVQSVEVRWRITTVPGYVRQVTSLVASASTPKGKTWTAPEGGIPVPKGATVAFDVIYHIDGRAFTDDNQGNWYIAD